MLLTLLLLLLLLLLPQRFLVEQLLMLIPHFVQVKKAPSCFGDLTSWQVQQEQVATARQASLGSRAGRKLRLAPAAGLDSSEYVEGGVERAARIIAGSSLPVHT